jgi:hypothetical protein
MDQREVFSPGASPRFMTRFRLACSHGWKAASNLIGPNSPDKGMRRLKCPISTHTVCKELHFGIFRGRYLFVFRQVVRP